MLLGLYRLGMQAIIILALYEFPVLQIILTLLLNFIWILIFIIFWPFEEKMDNVSELNNEFSLLFTIYFLFCLTG